MNTKNVSLLVVLVAVGVAGGYFLGGGMEHDNEQSVTETDTVPAGMHRMSDGTLMANNEVIHTMDHSSMLVTNERAFIEGMIPHHQEAIDTAKEVLARGGTTAEVRILAENIVAAQEQEIAQMKQWYMTWYEVEYQDTSVYQPMMRDLSTLSGAELDRVFIEDMIPHHEGALLMVESVTPYIEHPEMKALAAAIISTQTEEISYMRQLLETL